MKKFIFRNPFKSKNSKQLGKIHIYAAERAYEALEYDRSEFINIDGYDFPHLKDFISECYEEAARCYGFRNADDMFEYKEIHGHY